MVLLMFPMLEVITADSGVDRPQATMALAWGVETKCRLNFSYRWYEDGLSRCIFLATLLTADSKSLELLNTVLRICRLNYVRSYVYVQFMLLYIPGTRCIIIAQSTTPSLCRLNYVGFGKSNTCVRLLCF
jgi:hypothetical protein